MQLCLPHVLALLAPLAVLSACSDDSKDDAARAGAGGMAGTGGLADGGLGGGGQAGGSWSNVLCGEHPGGSAWAAHVLRFENAAGDVVAQLVRRYDGAGVGESSLFALDAFALVIDGVTHCVTAKNSLAYTNSHHNWVDRAAVELDGVSYELAMKFTFPAYGSRGEWSVDLTGTRNDVVVFEKTELTRTGGPLGCYTCPQPLSVYVSEVMIDNTETLADEAGEYEPWIELFNMGSDPVDLTGWWLSDDLSDRKRWRFPAVTIPRVGSRSLVVFADGEPHEGPLHSTFELFPRGGELILTAPDGVTDGGFVLESNEPDQSVILDLSDGAYMRSSEPTPGALNPNVLE